ncbi:MAG TPA: peptide chain release factor N(5)-glutamine methyltransferase [Ferruginibacter sp.]|nr:peptide chain release factor N(5)-glutamine methyltransferase [Ferruginibacter sp.]
MFVAMFLNELYRKYLHDLGMIYNEHEASVITSMIFESVAGIYKTVLIKDPGLVLDIVTANKLESALEKLLKNTPVQYVTGEAWFYKMKFNVSQDVLIPRPETEEMVDKAISFLHTLVTPAVIDIGTGSGCIAISIKKNMPRASLCAIDISNEALNIARQNAFLNGTEVKFQQLDFLHEQSWNLLDPYDVIVSNPPYIPSDEKDKLAKNVVDFEPAIALFAPALQPLIFFDKIALFGKKHLKREGKIFMEVHEALAKEVVSLFKKQGYQATIHKDIFDKERFVVATHSR